MNISAPFNVTRGTSSTSPIVRIDAKARAKVNWKTAGFRQKARAVFDSFVEVFRENNWRYAAGSFPGLQTQQILLGQQTMQQLKDKFHADPSMDCGRISNLLSIAMRALVPATPDTVSVIGHFVTPRLTMPPGGVEGEFRCIDRRVHGNVRTPNLAYNLVQTCLFRDHYAVRLRETGLIYDACLVAIYPDMNLVVDTLLKSSPVDPKILIPKTPPTPGGPPVVRYKLLKEDSPPGFSVGYMRQRPDISSS